MVGQMVLPVPGVIERGRHPRHSEYNLKHPVGPCPGAARLPDTAAPPCPEASLDLPPLTSSPPQEPSPHDSHSFISNILHQRISLYFCLYLDYVLHCKI